MSHNPSLWESMALTMVDDYKYYNGEVEGETTAMYFADEVSSTRPTPNWDSSTSTSKSVTSLSTNG